MSCKPFSELVYNEMGWDSDCRYKILGYRINFEGETLYVFDLLVPEIFHESQKRKKGESAPQSEETKPVNTRKGFYPDDIAGTFWRACRRTPERIRGEANRWVCVDGHPDGEGPQCQCGLD